MALLDEEPRLVRRMLGIAAVSYTHLDVYKRQEEDDASAAMVVRNLRVGLRFLFETPVLRSLFIVLIPVLISYGLSNSLLLPFSDRALGATEFEYGIQEALTSVAFVICSLIMAGICLLYTSRCV